MHQQLILRLGLGISLLSNGWFMYNNISQWSDLILPELRSLISIPLDQLIYYISIACGVLGILLLVNLLRTIAGIFSTLLFVILLIIFGVNEFSSLYFAALSASIIMTQNDWEDGGLLFWRE